MIAMVDVSSSMEIDNCIPLYTAMGLGIRISELSTTFKDEIITFSSNPEIIKLDYCDNFIDKVCELRKIEWGGNTNFEKALDLILDKCIRENTPPDEVKDIVMCVLSDMQIDEASEDSTNTMFDLIKEKYKNVGYEIPTILFWNLRKTNGFPSITTQENVIMVSGYNTSLLNHFSEKGVEGFKDITPFKMIKDILDNPRYNLMDLNKCIDNNILKDKSIDNKNNDLFINTLYHMCIGLSFVLWLRVCLSILILIVA